MRVKRQERGWLYVRVNVWHPDAIRFARNHRAEYGRLQDKGKLPEMVGEVQWLPRVLVDATRKASRAGTGLMHA